MTDLAFTPQSLSESDTSPLAQMASALGPLLVARELKLVVAESCTGGWLAQVLTATEGCSAWFDRGYVAYSGEAKRQMLGVKLSTMKKHGSVSRDTVSEMALGALKKSKADIAVAMTGVAGPGGGSEEKPVGTVWVAWAHGEKVDTVLMQLEGDRQRIRQGTLLIALQGLLSRVPEWMPPVPAKSEGDSKPESEPKAKSKAKSKPKAKSKSKAKPKAKRKAKTKSESKPKPDSKSKSKPSKSGTKKGDSDDQ